MPAGRLHERQPVEQPRRSRVAILWLLATDGTRPYSTTYHTGPSSTVLGMAMDDGDRQSTRKRRAILDAATTVFLTTATWARAWTRSPRSPASRSRPSTSTSPTRSACSPRSSPARSTRSSDPVHDEVLEPARQRRRGAPTCATWRAGSCAPCCSRSLLQLRRLVIGEVGRFPQLGRTFYERGPGRTIAALATTFERLAARGSLVVDDADLAASQFNWLVMSAPINQAMLLGRDDTVTNASSSVTPTTACARSSRLRHAQGPSREGGPLIVRPPAASRRGAR